jgi:hypothetical protein
MEEQRPPYRFPEKGVEVIVPWQNQHGDVEVAERDLGTFPCSKSGDEDFEFRREVINFELVKSTDRDTYLTEFDPHVTLKVYYKEEDVGFASEAGKPLAIAYCYGDRWIRFSEKNELENFPGEDLEWPGFAGRLEAKIQKWGDPSVAIGR